MKKIIYSGKEEGVFVFGTLSKYMEYIGALKFDGHGTDPANDSREFTLDTVWKKDNIRIDFLYRSKDNHGPITIIASGEINEISDFERVNLEENKRLTS